MDMLMMDEILDTSVEGMVHNIKFLASHLHTIVFKFALQLRLLLEKTVAFHGIATDVETSLLVFIETVSLIDREMQIQFGDSIVTFFCQDLSLNFFEIL
ncbi:hypothetical protein D8674_019481 [Pyrus ussuriensis x Pyrus communis]|uniref:Uncharacterized protein n=1 Tax=Pyrus ussuriensis x Pyrus communis TaxID=2448454 RepID=A0A5N5G7Q8_9ROSA|nr:hypothetical protein D8674_019481 [Pyrus ussuriensis x Pyrus communis]